MPDGGGLQRCGATGTHAVTLEIVAMPQVLCVGHPFGNKHEYL